MWFSEWFPFFNWLFLECAMHNLHFESLHLWLKTLVLLWLLHCILLAIIRLYMWGMCFLIPNIPWIKYIFNHRIYFVNWMNSISSGCGFINICISLMWAFWFDFWDVPCVVCSCILCLPLRKWIYFVVLSKFVFLRVKITASMMFDTSEFDTSVIHGGRCGPSIIILHIRRA